MIKINNLSSVSLGVLEDVGSSLFKSLWIEAGIDGVLPRIILELDGLPSKLELTEFEFSLVYSSSVIAKSNAIIDEITYKGITTTIIEAYLVDSVDFIRDRTINTYKSIREVVSSIWRGTNEMQIPNQENLYLCQLNEINHEYLTKALNSSSAEQTFYYSLFNSIIPVQLSDRVIDLDFTKDDADENVLIDLIDKEIVLSGNNAERIREYTGQVKDKYITVGGSRVFFSDNSTYQLEENYIRTRVILDSLSDKLTLDFNTPNIKIGDILKLRLNKEVVVTVILTSIQMYLTYSELKIAGNSYIFEI